MRIVRRFVALAALLLGLGAPADAAPIYVIDASHPMADNAKLYLSALGNTVTAGGTLASYAGYDQVWDLRYGGALTVADQIAMGAYLQSGGRMYLTGEHDGFDVFRNDSLLSFLSAVGAGAVTLQGGGFAGLQSITLAGAVVNSPNAVANVLYNNAQVTSAVGNGFLITETSPGSGQGSLVGWDFGDIAGSPNARMLVGFDIEIFDTPNGQAWTQNMTTYLGVAAGPGPSPVPEPGTLLLGGVALAAGLGRRARRTR